MKKGARRTFLNTLIFRDLIHDKEEQTRYEYNPE